MHHTNIVPDKIAIVVPVLNEAENVQPLAREISAALEPRFPDYELVFVDDGSTDATWEQIKEEGGLNPRVRGVQHARNYGQSAALWTGIQATDASTIVTLDGDRQNDPADLPLLLAELEQCDFVCGIREKRRDSWVRRVSSRIARRAREVVLRIDLQDVGCSLRAFKRPVLATAFPFNGLHRFLPILVSWAGWRVREIPVRHRPRTAGISKYGVWNRLGRGIVDLLVMAWFKRRILGPATIRDAVNSPPPKTEGKSRKLKAES